MNNAANIANRVAYWIGSAAAEYGVSHCGYASDSIDAGTVRHYLSSQGEVIALELKIKVAQLPTVAQVMACGADLKRGARSIIDSCSEDDE